MALSAPDVPGFSVNYRRQFGDRLKALRKERRLSQDGLAEETGLARPYISNLERGLANPSLGALLKIQRALKLSSIELLLTGITQWGSAELAEQAANE